MPKPTNAELAAKVAELEQQLAEATAPADETPATPPAAKPTNVIEAIIAVMRDVKALGKHERNTTPGQNYNFRGIDATVNALGPAMRTHGLVGIPTLLKVERRGVQTSQGKAQQASEVEVRYDFYGPGGVTDTVCAIVPGESWDSGDKGVSKAMSVAMRIALLQTFALPTDERDPDSDTHERAHNVDVAAFLAEVENALKQADPVDALKAVWDSHTEPVLDLVRVAHPNGGPETISGSQFINMHVQEILNGPKAASAELAQALAAAGELEDGDEQVEALRKLYRTFGKDTVEKSIVTFFGEPTLVSDVITRIVADVQTKKDAAQQPDAPAQDAPDEQPAQDEAARAPEPEVAREPAQQSEGAARAAEHTARTDTRLSDPAYTAFYDEIAGQATVMGVQPGIYVEPLLAVNSNASHVTDIPKPVVHRWIADQRPAVIDALRGQGRATEADAYAQVPPQRWGTWDNLTGANARSEEPVREPQDA